MVYAVKFWHEIEFVIDYVKISALYVHWWAETIRIVSVCTGHSEEMSDIHTSLHSSLQMTTWDLPAWRR